ncbi:hypothetical protein A2U01_0057457, partial [Trifolium medium]|nr:hypothetical protein [Trifolium medium]
MRIICSMDKKWGASVVVLVLLSFSSIIVVANVNANGASNTVDDEDQSKKSAMWVWQRLRSAYSMYYSSIFLPTTIGQYWHMAKTIVNHTYAYFFPPNI